MAMAIQKRRRGDDEASRPKKKFKKVKKQAAYHSSSEDDSDNDGLELNATHTASDVPQSKSVVEQTAMPQVAVLAQQTNPKSILRKSRTSSKSATLTANAKTNDNDAVDDNDDDEDTSMNELERNTALNALHASDSDEDMGDDNDDDEPDLDAASDSADEEATASESDDDAASATSSQASGAQKKKKKRNDPAAFATSISKILSTKLTASKRQDPLLSRSRSAADANRTLADAKLEQAARAQLRAEKKHAAEKGRVRDVLGLQAAAAAEEEDGEQEDGATGARVAAERRLKKTAQRGVVKLFNAVRAAQVKADEARTRARADGVVGMQKREERVNEMSKQGFLDLISSGGKKSVSAAAA